MAEIFQYADCETNLLGVDIGDPEPKPIDKDDSPVWAGEAFAPPK